MVNLDCLAKNDKGCIARFDWGWNGDISFQKLIVTPQKEVMLFSLKVKRWQKNQAHMN